MTWDAARTGKQKNVVGRLIPPSSRVSIFSGGGGAIVVSVDRVGGDRARTIIPLFTPMLTRYSLESFKHWTKAFSYAIIPFQGAAPYVRVSEIFGTARLWRSSAWGESLLWMPSKRVMEKLVEMKSSKIMWGLAVLFTLPLDSILPVDWQNHIVIGLSAVDRGWFTEIWRQNSGWHRLWCRSTANVCLLDSSPVVPTLISGRFNFNVPRSIKFQSSHVKRKSSPRIHPSPSVSAKPETNEKKFYWQKMLKNDNVRAPRISTWVPPYGNELFFHEFLRIFLALQNVVPPPIRKKRRWREGKKAQRDDDVK